MTTFPFDPTPETEIFSRIHQVRKTMTACGTEALFLTHKPDIYYFSGTAQDCYLYIPVDAEPVLFAKRYLPRVLVETPLSCIEPVDSVRQIPMIIQTRAKKMPKTCGLAFDVVPVKDYLFYQKLFKGTGLIDGSAIIETCRQIKSPFEIEQLEKAARVSARTFDYMGKNIRPDISEMEFCGMFESFARTLGHSGKLLTRHYRLEGFPFHLMSGKNGGMPGALDSPVCGTGTCNAYPYGAGPKLLKENEPVLIDFGTLLNGYHMDESRMFVMGKMPEKAMDASLVSIEILHRLLEKMTPGTSLADIFNLSVSLATSFGFEDSFLGLSDLKSKFIGHGIGLELVEAPVIAKGKKSILEPGMVFAVEPKFIFKDKFAAGVESVIHVTDTGGRFLSVTDHKVFVC